MMRYGFILLLSGVAGSAVAQAPVEIREIEVRESAVRLGWDRDIDRYIIERFTFDGQPVQAVATSSGRVDRAVAVGAPAGNAAFYRVRTGLQALPLTDEALEAHIRTALGASKMEPHNWLYDIELNALGSLVAAMRGIRTLEGLGGDISLDTLDLGGNRIDSLRALGDIADLEILRADGNALTDLAGLEGATALRVLDVSYNALLDLAALEGLTGLEVLYADNNEVASLAAVATMTGLRVLDLSNNRIESIAPLLQNAQVGGLGSGDIVYLAGNPIADEGEIAALRGYGVTVIFP